MPPSKRKAAASRREDRKRRDAAIPMVVVGSEPDELEEEKELGERRGADEQIVEVSNDANVRRLDDFLTTSSTFEVLRLCYVYTSCSGAVRVHELYGLHIIEDSCAYNEYCSLYV